MEKKLIPYKKQGKWGFCDEKKTLIIDCCYREVTFFDDQGLAVVSLEYGKWGVINHSSKQIIPCLYDKIDVLENGNFKIMRDQMCGILDNNGNVVLDEKYYSIVPLTENLFEVTSTNYQKFIINQYQQVIFNKELSINKLESKELIGIYKLKRDYSLYKELEIILTPLGYNSALKRSKNITILMNSIKFNLVSEDGEILLPHYPNEIKIIKEENVAIMTKGDDCFKDSDFGIVDFSGKILIPFQRQSINYLGEGYYSIFKDGKSIITDKYGRLLVNGYFEKTQCFSEGFSIVKKDGELSLLDTNGSLIKANKYDSIGDFKHGTAIVSQQGKFGLIDVNLKIIVECKFGGIKRISDKYFVIVDIKDRTQGLINNSGITIIPPIYFSIRPHDKQSVVVEKNRRFGVISLNGEMLMLCKYTSIHSPFENCSIVSKGKWTGMFIGGKKVLKIRNGRFFLNESCRIRGLLMVQIMFSNIGYIDLNGIKYWEKKDYKELKEKRKKKRISYNSNTVNSNTIDVDWSEYNEDLDPDQQSEDFWNQF